MPAGTSHKHIESSGVLTNLRDKTIPGVWTGGIAVQNQAAGLPGNQFQRLTTTPDQHPLGFLGGIQAGVSGSDACTGPDDDNNNAALERVRLSTKWLKRARKTG